MFDGTIYRCTDFAEISFDAVRRCAVVVENITVTLNAQQWGFLRKECTETSQRIVIVSEDEFVFKSITWKKGLEI